ncbi:hypothetical protein AMTRI_Chr02g211650 [Amborella trichopoda]
MWVNGDATWLSQHFEGYGLIVRDSLERGKRRRRSENKEKIFFGVVGIVEGSIGNLGISTEGVMERAGGRRVSNKPRAARQALSPSNDITTSIANKRDIL